MISIIIPTFNSDQFLEKCLESIREQNHEEYELIIIDNCSTDQTKNIIAKFSEIVDQFVSEHDKSNYEAINKGILLAKGNWIYVMGADDFLADKKTLSHVTDILIKLPPNVYISYGNVNVINNEEEVLYQAGSNWSEAIKQFKSKMNIPHQSVFHRAEVFIKFGLFDTTFKYAGDYDFLLRVLLRYPPNYMNIIVAGYRFTGGSSRAMSALKVQKEYRLAQLKNSYPLTFSWVIGYLRTLVRLIIWKIFGKYYSAKIDDVIRVVFGKKKIWTKIYINNK